MGRTVRSISSLSDNHSNSFQVAVRLAHHTGAIPAGNKPLHIARRGCRLDELCASGRLRLISSSRSPFSSEDCFFPSTDFAFL